MKEEPKSINSPLKVVRGDESLKSNAVLGNVSLRRILSCSKLPTVNGKVICRICEQYVAADELELHSQQCLRVSKHRQTIMESEIKMQRMLRVPVDQRCVAWLPFITFHQRVLLSK